MGTKKCEWYGLNLSAIFQPVVIPYHDRGLTTSPRGFEVHLILFFHSSANRKWSKRSPDFAPACLSHIFFPQKKKKTYTQWKEIRKEVGPFMREILSRRKREARESVVLWDEIKKKISDRKHRGKRPFIHRCTPFSRRCAKLLPDPFTTISR